MYSPSLSGEVSATSWQPGVGNLAKEAHSENKLKGFDVGSSEEMEYHYVTYLCSNVLVYENLAKGQ